MYSGELGTASVRRASGTANAGPRRRVRFDVEAAEEENVKGSATGLMNGKVDENGQRYLVKGYSPKYPLKQRRSRRKASASASSAASESSMINMTSSSSSSSANSSASSVSSVGSGEKLVILATKDPDALKTQFLWARKTANLNLLESILQVVKSDAEKFRKKLSDRVMNEALSFAILSGQVAIAELLIRFGATVKGADGLYDEAKGDLGTCECGSHPGLLLVTVVRQSNHAMTKLLLDGGINVNTQVCDGETKRIWWGVGLTFQGIQTVKTPVLKSELGKTTPLSAACANGDIRLVQLLIEHGASIDACDFTAIAEAVVVFDSRRQVLKYLLKELSRSSQFKDACAVALRTAASRGDTSTLNWIIERLEQQEDWETTTLKSPRKAKRKGSHEPIGSPRGNMMRNGGKASPNAFDDRNSLNSYSSGSSFGSGSSNSCLKQNAMAEFEKRRASMNLNPGSRPLSEPNIISRKPLYQNSGNGDGNSSSSSSSSKRKAKKQPLSIVDFALGKAIGDLIQLGAQPDYALRSEAVRGLEALLHIAQFRGAQLRLESQIEDVFNLFLETLKQEGMSSSRDALTLLSCGLDVFLSFSNDDDDDQDNGGNNKSKAPRRKKKNSFVKLVTKNSNASKGGNGMKNIHNLTINTNVEEDTSANNKRKWTPKQAWGKLRAGISKVTSSSSSSSIGKNTPASTSTTPTKRPSFANIPKASHDDAVKALTMAVRGGHVLVTERLLATSSRDVKASIPKLLYEAAEHNQIDFIDMLIRRYKDVVDQVGLPTGTMLNQALLTALEHESVEFAKTLMSDKGVVPSKDEVVVPALLAGVVQPEYNDDAIDLLVDIMDEYTIVLSMEDVARVLDAITTCTGPNLYVLACVLDLDEKFRHAVSKSHLVNLVHSSSEYQNNPEWQELLQILLKCIEKNPQLDEIIQDVFEEAASAQQVHAGVLHTLMESSGHHEDSERWV